MNTFYTISEEGKKAQEFEIEFFGDKVRKNQIYAAGGGSIGMDYKLMPAKDIDYDMKFREKLYSLKPIYKVTEFLEFQFSNFKGEPIQFISQMKYVILPKAKNGKPNHAQLIEDWISSKEEKQISNTYAIHMNDVNAPIQIQQNSNHSTQSQKITAHKETIKQLFEFIKRDIENLDKSIREDFNIEMNYAVKQLEKEQDISPQLLNIGNLITNVGLPIFTNLVASGFFELIKPFIGN